MLKLLKEYNANLNDKDKEGIPPLFYALEQTNSEMTRYLIQNGADIEI